VGVKIVCGERNGGERVCESYLVSRPKFVIALTLSTMRHYMDCHDKMIIHHELLYDVYPDCRECSLFNCLFLACQSSVQRIL